MKKSSVLELVFMAFYVALFMVLDYITNMLSILQMPQGGSLGISTIALLMASYHLGWQKGLMVSCVSILAQFVTGPMYTPDLLGFLLDYGLAFSVYGLACLFPNVSWFYSGVLVTNLVRFLSSTISGVIVYQTTWWGSVTYNASYMIPTCILGLILIPVLDNALKRYTKRA